MLSCRRRAPSLLSACGIVHGHVDFSRVQASSGIDVRASLLATSGHLVWAFWNTYPRRRTAGTRYFVGPPVGFVVCVYSPPHPADLFLKRGCLPAATILILPHPSAHRLRQSDLITLVSPLRFGPHAHLLHKVGGERGAVPGGAGRGHSERGPADHTHRLRTGERHGLFHKLRGFSGASARRPGRYDGAPLSNAGLEEAGPARRVAEAAGEADSGADSVSPTIAPRAESRVTSILEFGCQV